MDVKNKKMDMAMSNLLSRQDYLVTQANELAKSFGNLTAFEHKILDFCFSFVERDHTSDHTYQTTALDIIHHFGLNTSGRTYNQVAQAFRALTEKTAIFLRTNEPDGSITISMTPLFGKIALNSTGAIEFKFNPELAPYIFQLRKQFYSFKLSELAKVKGKYTLTLLKLWNANCMGKLDSTTIQGSIEDWQSWFLGGNQNGNRTMKPGVFKNNVLNRACAELEKIYPVMVTITTFTERRKVLGYRLDIVQLKDKQQLE